MEESDEVDRLLQQDQEWRGADIRRLAWGCFHLLELLQNKTNVFIIIRIINVTSDISSNLLSLETFGRYKMLSHRGGEGVNACRSVYWHSAWSWQFAAIASDGANTRVSVYLLYVCRREDPHNSIELPEPPAICLLVVYLDYISCQHNNNKS